METKFIVDSNAGKLAKLLRTMGYDTLFFDNGDDSEMVAKAMKEDRVILTRDTQIMNRRVVTNGRLKAVLIASDQPEEQLCQTMDVLNLHCWHKPFTICLECNQPLVERNREQIKERVPPHVLKTQDQYMECPKCHRIYWRGTHWQAMNRKLEKLAKC